MDVSELKNQIRQQVAISFQHADEMSRESIEERGRRVIKDMSRDARKLLDEVGVGDVLSGLCNDLLGYGPLQPFFDDDSVTEIMVNGPNEVFVEREGHKTSTNVRYNGEAHLRMGIERMMEGTGRRLDESMPLADFALDDGSRVNIIIPPLALGGAHMTIRKFLETITNMDHLVGYGTLDERMANFLVAAIHAKKNILFSGATGCGKTTTLGALSSYLSPQERVVVIEDTPELELRQEHVVRLLTRPPNSEGRGEMTLRDLLKNSLRMRPSRILVGEIRGEEAMDYLQALNSGHRGCLAVMHASTPWDTVSRLETMALFSGLNLPVHAIRQQIASGLDIIVQQDQLHDGSRKVTHITEVRGMDGHDIQLQDIFSFHIEKTDEQGKVHGTFRAVSVPPDLQEYRRKGIEVDDAWFTESA